MQTRLVFNPRRRATDTREQMVEEAKENLWTNLREKYLGMTRAQFERIFRAQEATIRAAVDKRLEAEELPPAVEPGRDDEDTDELYATRDEEWVDAELHAQDRVPVEEAAPIHKHEVGRKKALASCPVPLNHVHKDAEALVEQASSFWTISRMRESKGVVVDASYATAMVVEKRPRPWFNAVTCVLVNLPSMKIRKEISEPGYAGVGNERLRIRHTMINFRYLRPLVKAIRGRYASGTQVHIALQEPPDMPVAILVEVNGDWAVTFLAPIIAEEDEPLKVYDLETQRIENVTSSDIANWPVDQPRAPPPAVKRRRAAPRRGRTYNENWSANPERAFDPQHPLHPLNRIERRAEVAIQMLYQVGVGRTSERQEAELTAAIEAYKGSAANTDPVGLERWLKRIADPEFGGDAYGGLERFIHRTGLKRLKLLRSNLGHVGYVVAIPAGNYTKWQARCDLDECGWRGRTVEKKATAERQAERHEAVKNPTAVLTAPHAAGPEPYGEGHPSDKIVAELVPLVAHNLKNRGVDTRAILAGTPRTMKDMNRKEGRKSQFRRRVRRTAKGE